MLPPLRFVPVLKRIRWGGRRLGDLLHKAVGPESDYAESWEIADHADGQSRVANGPLAGQLLSSLINRHPQELLGKYCSLKQFPLLIKFLDANDWLSLQVHPDDLLAKRFNTVENGKTEAWVILEALPESQICCGLKAGVTPQQLRSALESHQDDAIQSCLNMIPVRAGDCVYVPAGTVHALGPGILLAEIQQQSNLTFRLFDWGRVDASGKPRTVHIDEAIDCTDFGRGPVFPVQPVEMCDSNHAFEELIRCSHFVIRRHRFLDPIQISTGDSFRILLSLKGNAEVKSQFGSAPLEMGSTVLLPACSGTTKLIPAGAVTLLEVLCP